MQIKRNDTYEDILYMERPVSPNRKRMSMRDRAAQFAPFAALTGHEDAVRETARLTVAKIELDENEVERLDQKLQYLTQQLFSQQRDNRLEFPTATITYFVPDPHKSGGKYVKTEGGVKKYNQFTQELVMEDGTIIPIPNILRINLEI